MDQSIPFESIPSLVPLIDFWRQLAEGEGAAAALAKGVLARLEQAPALAEPLTDLAVLDEHRDLVAVLMSAVFPAARWADAVAAAVPPFRNRPLYATPSFERLQLLDPANTHGQFKNLDPASFNFGRTIKAYGVLLRQLYGVTLDFNYPVVFTTHDAERGLTLYYKLQFDARFCRAEPRGPLPELGPEDLQRLVASPTDLSLWQELLPPERFAFYGFVVITALDVTDQEVLSALKDDLLQQDAMAGAAQIDRLQDRLRTLVRCPDLELGLIGLERSDIDAMTEARAVGRSLLIDEQDGVPICPSRAASVYARALDAACEPVVVRDLADWQPQTAFEKRLLARGLRNVVLAPLRVKDELVGLLELASPRAGALNYLNGIKMTDAVPLFATALKRMLDEREDRVQALIKERYTAIHPVVEWRFRKAALDIMERDVPPSQMPAIVFPGVYPLYGLSDIRDSSTHRNAAIQADLVEQLSMALQIIVEAGMYRPLPILDELGHRIANGAEAIRDGLNSEDEGSVLDFLRNDVEPLFDHLAGFGPRVRERVDAYRDALDPTLGVLYRRRREFEESVMCINDTISSYLDEQERHAQAMFPHYFEKYKTDGVDYNLYVGASLLEAGTFDILYLHNLRLWQLMTMCGTVWALDRLRPRLNVPLHTTHLVLVQSTPLSIRFRQDEKKFDVDGAYNIRYEIVKKRIDKATVHGGGERLTQPGHIAIVYTQPREAQEYRRYVDYLQAAGYLEPGIEELELDELQGLHGLKALRVQVAPRPPASDIHVEPARIRTAIQTLMPALV